MLPTPSWLRFRKSRSQQQHEEQEEEQHQHHQQQIQHQQQPQKPASNNNNNNNNTDTDNNNDNDNKIKTKTNNSAARAPHSGHLESPSSAGKTRLPLVRRALANLLARASGGGRSPLASGAGDAPLPAAGSRQRAPKSPLRKLKRRVKSGASNDTRQRREELERVQPKHQDQGGAELKRPREKQQWAGCQQIVEPTSCAPLGGEEARQALGPQQRQPTMTNRGALSLEEPSLRTSGEQTTNPSSSPRARRLECHAGAHNGGRERSKGGAAEEGAVSSAGRPAQGCEESEEERSAQGSQRQRQQTETIPAVCQLTSKTSDNQCALHRPVPITAAASSAGHYAPPRPASKSGDLAAVSTMSPDEEGLARPEARELAVNQRQTAAAPPPTATTATATTKGRTQAGSQRRRSAHAGACGERQASGRRRRRSRKRAACSGGAQWRLAVASWPIARQTLGNNSSFGDCEDIMSPHLSGRLSTATRTAPTNGGSPGQQEEGGSMAQQSNYNHKRPFGQCFVRPTTGWLQNAVGAEKINLTNSSGSLKAKLLAARGFRRRSYDDQEGDNDFNIIIQPSDLHEIEKRASYNNSSNNYKSYSQLRHLQQKRTTSNIASTGFFATSSAQSRDSLAELASLTVSDNRRTIQQEAASQHQDNIKKVNEPTTETTIMTDLNLAKCLLDQDYNRTVQLFIRKSALNWNFNAFTFDALCCGRSLTELLLHLFDYYDLYRIFNLDIVNVLKCFRLLEFGYHSTNPYHNSIHAADVTQAMHCFIQENKIRKHMTHLETLCSILAAVCHDLDHPGVNQSFLVATNNPLASLYNNNSVLENHHWRFALCIFKESNLFDHFSEEIFDELKQQLKHLILATDIARQNEYLKRFKDLTQSREFSMQNTEDRALVLQMALKCADLGNPCRPWLISRVWSNLICDEFYKMGKIERQLGIPLTPICQREKNSIAGIQTDFFRFIVLPLLELWHKFLDTPLSSLLMSNFDHNYKRWQRANRIVQQLRRRKSVACLEPIDCEESSSIDYNNYCDNNAKRRTEGEVRRKGSDDNELLSITGTATRLSLCSKHSYEAIKRASSDYIKSGNGKLELLRNYQLDRIIEKSPLTIRSKSNRNKQTEGIRNNDSNSEGSAKVNNGLMKSIRSVKYYPLIISLTS